MRNVPDQIVGLAKDHQILFSAKARHQIDTGIFNTDDLIHSMLYGEVVKKEIDERKAARYKYTIAGPSRLGITIYSCGKIINLLGKAYYIITFHEMR